MELENPSRLLDAPPENLMPEEEPHTQINIRVPDTLLADLDEMCRATGSRRNDRIIDGARAQVAFWRTRGYLPTPVSISEPTTQPAAPAADPDI